MLPELQAASSKRSLSLEKTEKQNKTIKKCKLPEQQRQLAPPSSNNTLVTEPSKRSNHDSNRTYEFKI
jgi:hypothetical protein